MTIDHEMKKSGKQKKFVERCMDCMGVPPGQRSLKQLSSVASGLEDVLGQHKLKQTQKLELVQAMSLESFAPGEYVIHMGDIGDKWYIVLQGSLKVFRPNNHLQDLMKKSCQVANEAKEKQSDLIYQFKKELGGAENVHASVVNHTRKIALGAAGFMKQHFGVAPKDKQNADEGGNAAQDGAADGAVEGDPEEKPGVPPIVMPNKFMKLKRSIARRSFAVSPNPFSSDALKKMEEDAEEELTRARAQRRAEVYFDLLGTFAGAKGSSLSYIFEDYNIPKYFDCSLETAVPVDKNADSDWWTCVGQIDAARPIKAFGEIALIKDVPRAATIRAETRTLLLTVDKADYQVIKQGGALMQMQNRLEFLKDVYAFRNLAESTLLYVNNFLGSPLTLERGDEICTQDEPVTFVYLIQSGELKVLAKRESRPNGSSQRAASARGQVEVALLGPKNFVGDMDVLLRFSGYSFTVVVNTMEAQVFRIKLRDFLQFPKTVISKLRQFAEQRQSFRVTRYQQMDDVMNNLPLPSPLSQERLRERALQDNDAGEAAAASGRGSAPPATGPSALNPPVHASPDQHMNPKQVKNIALPSPVWLRSAENTPRLDCPFKGSRPRISPRGHWALAETPKQMTPHKPEPFRADSLPRRLQLANSVAKENAHVAQTSSSAAPSPAPCTSSAGLQLSPLAPTALTPRGAVEALSFSPLALSSPTAPRPGGTTTPSALLGSPSLSDNPFKYIPLHCYPGASRFPEPPPATHEDPSTSQSQSAIPKLSTSIQQNRCRSGLSTWSGEPSSRGGVAGLPHFSPAKIFSGGPKPSMEDAEDEAPFNRFSLTSEPHLATDHASTPLDALAGMVSAESLPSHKQTLRRDTIRGDTNRIEAQTRPISSFQQMLREVPVRTISTIPSSTQYAARDLHEMAPVTPNLLQWESNRRSANLCAKRAAASLAVVQQERRPHPLSGRSGVPTTSHAAHALTDIPTVMHSMPNLDFWDDSCRALPPVTYGRPRESSGRQPHPGGFRQFRAKQALAQGQLRQQETVNADLASPATALMVSSMDLASPTKA
ncbi:hypothetical protein CYMTET_12840 [Cymbomonas tetramitiformis]|uniref:Cyclic nucleotide-binding domain-containing protein n=1 Tax=Cymbomonas tetramitiformis TaxID=36881 RepID=A0AAE0GJ99_9CHLO|nr:hypothetical protein CYMTET_12840 [Cymbomonas tetramitiformis]